VSSLNNGTARLGEFEAKWPGMETFLGFGILGPGSEKGSSRESTENRVARWMSLFWGNFRVLR
jgi:hypothetical protein